MTGPEPRPSRRLYGVVHLPPLPGTPFHENGSLPRIVEQAAAQAGTMAENGLDGVLLQTVDRVYTVEDTCDPARLAAVTLCAQAVAALRLPGIELGVQIMRHAVSASLAVAKVVGGTFVRADAIVGATLSTHGVVQPDPMQIMTYRRSIDAFDLRLVADIDSMHYRWPLPGESTGDVARRALVVGADAVCIAHADPERALAAVADVRRCAPAAQVVLGGFVTHDNAARLMAQADAAFVSGCLTDRADPARLDPARIRRLVDIVRSID